MRRVYLRGQTNILKRLLIHISGFNLGLLMRQLIGVGTPRGLQSRLTATLGALFVVCRALWGPPMRYWPSVRRVSMLERASIAWEGLAHIDTRKTGFYHGLLGTDGSMATEIVSSLRFGFSRSSSSANAVSDSMMLSVGESRVRSRSSDARTPDVPRTPRRGHRRRRKSTRRQPSSLLEVRSGAAWFICRVTDF